jgi:hypothetical protein
LLLERELLLPDSEPAQIICQYVTTYKARRQLVGSKQCVDQKRWFFLLRIYHGSVLGSGVMYGRSCQESPD